MAVTAALVPPWLEQLLTTPFFATCRIHGDAARSESNMFCIDCPSAAAFCFYCRSSYHADHRTIQIRRSSYHDVVRVSEVQKMLDIGSVQTYVINSARVLFLNERPQPRGGSSASSSSSTPNKLPGGGSSGSGAAHICEICSRTLLDPFRFCSLGCKLEGIKRNGDACFVPEEGDEEDEEDGRKASSAAAGGGEEGRRRRRGRAAPGGGTLWERVARRGGGGRGEEMSSSPTTTTPPATAPSTATATATTTSPTRSSNRRRKGVPHRAPLAS